MILVTGGTGTLGRSLVRRLVEAGSSVRLLLRDGTPPPVGVEGVTADLADQESVARAVSGVTAIVSAMTGFNGSRRTTPQLVDGQGNRNLVSAAAAEGVRRFVLVSIRGASVDHPIDVYRMKYLAEQELLASGLDWTIIRPTVYMQTWGELVGGSVLRGGTTRVFGTGDNPINFISADDVARIILATLEDRSTVGAAIDLAGPGNFSLIDVVRTFEKLSGRSARVQHVPVLALRLASALLPAFNATAARLARAGLAMATEPMASQPVELQRLFPGLRLTTFDEFARERVTPTDDLAPIPAH